MFYIAFVTVYCHNCFCVCMDTYYSKCLCLFEKILVCMYRKNPQYICALGPSVISSTSRCLGLHSSQKKIDYCTSL